MAPIWTARSPRSDDIRGQASEGQKSNEWATHSLYLPEDNHSRDQTEYNLEYQSIEEQEDPDLAGRCVLLVLHGVKARRRLLRNMRASGVRLLCYAAAVSPWASAYIDDNDWILGPVGDHHMALDAVKSWIKAETLRSQTDQGSESAPAASKSAIERHNTITSKIDAVMSYDEYGIQLASLIAEVSAWVSIMLPVLDITSTPDPFQQIYRPMLRFGPCPLSLRSLDYREASPPQ